MRFSKEEFLAAAGDLVLSNTIKGNPRYEWIDVVGIPQRPKDLESSLYFATHSDGTDGWHNPFDRRKIAHNVYRDKGWHLVVEEDFDTKGAEYVVAQSLLGLSQRIYEDARNRTKPYVVGVTGSIGKTTTVAFLEHLLRVAGYDAVRFWSKRLTPLLVRCHYINRVVPTTQFVVMEYSAFGKEQVSELAEMLPADIAFMINIYEMHVGKGLFRSESELFESKLKIKPEGSVGIMNSSILERLGIELPVGWNVFDMDTGLYSDNPLLPPTRRTAELHTAGRILAEKVGIPLGDFREAFATFIPQEKRIATCIYKGSKIFFDGEATGASRLLSWFETIDGSQPLLLIERANEMLASRELLMRVFENGQTFVLDTRENRENVPVRAQFVSEEKFGKILEKGREGYVVYHKGLATRQPNFDPTDYLRNRW